MSGSARQRINAFHPHGVVVFNDGKIGLPIIFRQGGGERIKMLTGDGRGVFKATVRNLKIFLTDGTVEQVAYCRNISTATMKGNRFLVYLREEGDVTSLVWAAARQGEAWKVKGETMIISRPGIIAAGGEERAPELVFGDYFLRIARGNETGSWEIASKIIAAPRQNRFDFGALRPLWAQYDRQGVFVVYDCSWRIDVERALLQVGCLLLDREDPKQTIWRAETSLFAQVYQQKGEVRPVGAVARRDHIYVYWEFEGGEIVGVAIPNPLYQQRRRVMPVVGLVVRQEKNPILRPDLRNTASAQDVGQPEVKCGDVAAKDARLPADW